MKDKKSAFDQFLEIIGDRNYPLRKDDYKSSALHQYAILKGMACIGPCFFLIGDMHAMKFLEVSDGSRDVIGYTPEEIFEKGVDFLFNNVHPDDQEQCMQMIKTGWEFLKDLPTHLKLTYVSNFYYRAVKKDGTATKVQHQVINLETDINGEILMACVIITDVSHLNLSDHVKLAMVNPNDNTCFSATRHQPGLIRENAILSKREAEILKLISQGLNSRQIAEKLVISYYTVRTHRKNILEKLGKKNTAEMISYTLYNGLI